MATSPTSTLAPARTFPDASAPPTTSRRCLYLFLYIIRTAPPSTAPRLARHLSATTTTTTNF
eukprot:4331655-Pyramimonas_sp.AAC.1